MSGHWSIAKLDKATDTLYLNHLNRPAGFRPEIGRSLRVVYTTKF
jgi:hypothetical protein